MNTIEYTDEYIACLSASDIKDIMMERDQLKLRVEALEEEVEEMEKNVDFLRTLEACGVDNWDGYEMAADSWRESQSDEDE